MVLLEGIKKEQEEMEQQQSGTGGIGRPNKMSQPGGGGVQRGETVQYINEHTEPKESE